jgi:hypothetical protein
MFGPFEPNSMGWFYEVFRVLLVLPFIAFGLLVLNLPIGIIREFQRFDDENAPEWMGDARGRKQRLAIVLVVFLVLGGAFSLYLLLLT